MLSDHSFVELSIGIDKFERGKGVWKFNCALLKDKNYLMKINFIIDDQLIQYSVPVYNIENINSIPKSDLPFTIEDLLLETILSRRDH